jgi:hypothetical protein
VSTSDLTADLFFVSALRAAADRSRTRLLPLAELKEPLAPHDRFAQRMLLALCSLGYIEPELSRSWADDWLHGRDWLSQGFENVSWRVLRPPEAANEALRMWSDGLDASPCTLQAWAVIWEDLALAELVDYAQWSLADAGFNPEWARDATDAFQAGLATFSIHQAMYLVFIALRSLALEQRRPQLRSCKPGHAFSAAVRNYVRRASMEGWTIRGISGTSDRRRSAIVALFAETVTGLGERYYSEHPSVDALAHAALRRPPAH